MPGGGKGQRFSVSAGIGEGVAEEEEVVDEVAFPEAAGFLDKAVEPGEAGFLHPFGGERTEPGEEGEGIADGEEDAVGVKGPFAGDPGFLADAAEGDPDKIGGGVADGAGEGVAIVVAPLAERGGEGGGDVETGVEGAEGGDEAVEEVGSAADEEVADCGGGAADDLPHEVGSIDAVGETGSAAVEEPDERHAIGEVEGEGAEDGGEGGGAAGFDGEVGVAGGDGGCAGFLGEVEDAGGGVGEAEAGERDPEDGADGNAGGHGNHPSGAGWGDPAESGLIDLIDLEGRSAYVGPVMSAHLEKVLRHAERKLIQSAKRNPTDLLDLYRDFLKLEEHRLFLAHKAGENGRLFARKRADLINVVLRHIWETAIATVGKAQSEKLQEESLALVAVGGFGRGELCPFSDVDLLFLYDKPSRNSQSGRVMKNVIEEILYVLWDVGFKVGHASRTVEEAIEQGNADMQTKTSLLEARLVVGPERMFREFEKRFQRYCVDGQEQDYLAWRLRDQEARHQKYNGTVFVQEPHVKNGCGGLRDYQNLLWVARVRKGLQSTAELQEQGWLTASERKAIDAGYDFILRIRNELHYLQKRPGEILTLKLQGQIANRFGYGQKNILRRTEALMRDYYQSARDVYQVCNLLARRLSGEAKKSNGRFWSFLPSKARKRVVVDGFVLEGGELTAESRNVFSEDPLRMVRVFQIMQQQDAVLSAELEALIRRRLNVVNRRFLWLQEVREILVAILKKKGKTGRILRAMHETGVLGRLIPEFEPLTCLVQHEFFHIYTADEHTLVCIEQLDRVIDCPDAPFPKYRDLFLRCEMPEILYLALVLHDVGKAHNTRNHSEMSAQLATRFARRMKFRSRQLQNLIFLVDHHMTLSEFAQRRNLDDPVTVREFARIVQDEERLDMLMLLTFADGQGTSGNFSWTDWKELLVWQLYRSTKVMLAGEEEFLRRAEVHRGEILQRVRPQVDRKISDEEFAIHFQMMPDRYLLGTTEPLMARHVELVNRFLVSQVAHAEEALKPSIMWIDHENEGHSEVVVVTWNRDRLFSKIAGAFAIAELNILSADIFTRKDDIVVDTFRVCTTRLEAVTNKVDRRTFETTLEVALQHDGYDFEKELAQKRRRQTGGLEGAEFPTRFHIDNEASEDYSLLNLQTPDRIGLLHDITSALADLGVGIYHSRITTEKGAALDSFYIAGADGGKITDKAEQEKILQTLRVAITRTDQ